VIRPQRYEGKFRNNKQHGVGVFVDVDGTVSAAEWIEGAISRTIPNSRIGQCQEEAAHASQMARSKKDLLMQMLTANAVVIGVRVCVCVCVCATRNLWDDSNPDSETMSPRNRL